MYRARCFKIERVNGVGEAEGRKGCREEAVVTTNSAATGEQDKTKRNQMGGIEIKRWKTCGWLEWLDLSRWWFASPSRQQTGWVKVVEA